jgi:predicted metal-dependent peptidase
MMDEAKFNLNHHIIGLLRNEPFFAALSRRINKMASTAIPTAGVRVNPETAQFEMLYNPAFFAKLTHDERLDVLKHEFYHLIFEHVTTRKPKDVGPRIWNFAADLAINSHLENLPEGCLMPGEGFFVDFERGLSAEQYLSLLLKKQKEDKKEKGDGEGGGDGGDETGDDGLPKEGQFDSHDEWSDGPGSGDAVEDKQAADIASERIKDFIKKSVDEAVKQGSRGWGTVPADVRRDILARLETRVDWKKVLRYFIKTSRRSNRSSTVKRVNKRYRYIHPGKKVNRTANIAISIDQSGSVSDEMLATFFGELNKLSALASFTVVPFDTRVNESLVYEWKKGQKMSVRRVMCGGTDFNAPTKYVNGKGFDGHIILTDMAASKPVASKCQRMWMTTKQCLQYQYFQTNERILAIDA